jgi:hypothetical protein
MSTTPPRPRPARAPGWALGDALGRSEPLAGLLQRIRASEARWAAVRTALPAALAATIRPGPLDDTQWVLLVPHAATAAKLRQFAPTLQQRLLDAGHPVRELRVRIAPSGA